MRNLEIKVSCLDMKRLERAAEDSARAGAVHAGRLEQRDTYFRTSRGRLKLREWTHKRTGAFFEPGNGAVQTESAILEGLTDQAGSSLIAYTRPDEAGSRTSTFHLVHLSDGSTARNALEATLGSHVVVEKTRELFLYHSTRIHLDNVRGLGAFIELETVLPDGTFSASETAFREEHDYVIRLLGLDELNSIPTSYSDLMLGTIS